jgi:hypothetical protein
VRSKILGDKVKVCILSDNSRAPSFPLFSPPNLKEQSIYLQSQKLENSPWEKKEGESPEIKLTNNDIWKFQWGVGLKINKNARKAKQSQAMTTSKSAYHFLSQESRPSQLHFPSPPPR